MGSMMVAVAKVQEQARFLCIRIAQRRNAAALQHAFCLTASADNHSRFSNVLYATGLDTNNLTHAQ